MRYRRGLRKRTAVVVGINGSSIDVIESKSDEVRSWVKSYEDDFTFGDMTAIKSARFRMGLLAGEKEWAGLQNWCDDHGDDLIADVADRRAFALELASAGQFSRLDSTGLTASECTWLAMHAYRFSGQHRRALDSALRLDPDAYPDHTLVILEALCRLPGLARDPAVTDHATRTPLEFPGASVVRVLSLGFESLTIDDLRSAVLDLASISSSELRNAAEGVLADRGIVDVSFWSRVSTRAVLDAADLEAVWSEYPSVADDVIDQRRVRPEEFEKLETLYLQARVDVEALSNDQVMQLSLDQEVARRAFARGDTETLRRLDTPEARFLLAADSLRRGEVPHDLPDDRVLQAVAASLRAGRAHPNALEDPSAWTVLGDLIDEDDAERHPQLAAQWRTLRALEAVRRWDFDGAQRHARHALLHSDDESLRDEALNVMAFYHYQAGHDDEAVAALEKALEGQYSANLQANVGLVARELKPEVAAEHLARLAEEAPSLELKFAAVRHAFAIWTTSTAAWDQDGLALPDGLVSTFRSVVVSDIPYEDYRSTLRLLSQADADWVAREPNTNRGPHRASDARTVYVARAAHDPMKFVEALVAVSKRNSEDWFLQEKDDFVSSLRSMIFDDPDAIGAASFAFAAIDKGLELDDFDYVTLACGAARSILTAIAKDEGLPSDAVTSMIATAAQRLKRLDADQRERLEPLVWGVSDHYGAVVATFHAGVHDHIIEALQTMSRQMMGIPRHRVRWEVVDEAIEPLRRQARASATEVGKASDSVHDVDLKKHLIELRGVLDALANNLSSARKAFA